MIIHVPHLRHYDTGRLVLLKRKRKTQAIGSNGEKQVRRDGVWVCQVDGSCLVFSSNYANTYIICTNMLFIFLLALWE